jgi:hypothetical protein
MIDTALMIQAVNEFERCGRLIAAGLGLVKLRERYETWWRDDLPPDPNRRQDAVHEVRDRIRLPVRLRGGLYADSPMGEASARRSLRVGTHRARPRHGGDRGLSTEIEPSPSKGNWP